MTSGSHPCSRAMGSRYCKRPVDETTCLLRDKLYKLLTMHSSHCRILLQNLHKSDAELGQTLEVCKAESVHSMLKYSRMFKVFPEAELSSYVRHEMLQPRTATLMMAEALPPIWSEFEKAMTEVRGLKFSHNYYMEDNSWMLNRRSKLVVSCGLPKAQKVVARRVNNFLTSGTWDFWVSLDSRKIEKRSDGNEPRPRRTPEFEPLTLSHDSMYILALISGSTTAASLMCFLVGIGPVWLKKLWGCLQPQALVYVYKAPH